MRFAKETSSKLVWCADFYRHYLGIKVMAQKLHSYTFHDTKKNVFSVTVFRMKSIAFVREALTIQQTSVQSQHSSTQWNLSGDK